ncbi:cytochrome P450 family protein [Pseudonocardia spinosispora]|uniref:cytochrome P450 family protein n=1 Tax=Pseudonocardia spinosispora TaxID=103441 RepID=UPI000424B748|nr:cytochrome P450 [Pseudonocardia spinosispora]
MSTVRADEPALTAPELLADPYGGYRRLREQAPVLRGRYLDDSPIWYVTRYEDVRSVLADDRFVNNAPGEAADRKARLIESLGIPPDITGYLTESILSSDGATHMRLRKLVSRAFTVRRVAQLRPSVERITTDLLDGLGDGPVDLVEHFSYPLPITVICDLVGIPEADRAQWHVWGKALSNMRPGEVGPAARGCVDYLNALIEQRRAAPQDDLIDALIAVHDEGDRLSDVEMVTMVVTLVFAGHETTAHLISNATVALLTHPDQLARLREDPALWPGVVHELMRWCGPVQITALRYATQDVELGGTLIRAGEAVQPVLVSANRDPRQYPHADELDVTRRAAERGEGHVGFGHGAHYCLGAALAKQEAEVALSALFSRFPALALACAPGELAWDPIPGARRLHELPVITRLTE